MLGLYSSSASHPVDGDGWEGVRLRTRGGHVAPRVSLASVDCLLGAGTAGTPREPVETFYIFIILFYICYLHLVPV